MQVGVFFQSPLGNFWTTVFFSQQGTKWQTGGAGQQSRDLLLCQWLDHAVSPSPSQPEAAAWLGSCPWPQTIPGWPCLENPQEVAAAPCGHVPQWEISPCRFSGGSSPPRGSRSGRGWAKAGAPAWSRATGLCHWSLPHPSRRRGWVPVARLMACRSPTAPRPRSRPATRSSGFSIDPRANTSPNQVERQFCMSKFTLKMYNFWSTMTSQQRYQVTPSDTRSITPNWVVGRGRAAVPQAGQQQALQETCTVLETVLSSRAALICLCSFAAFYKYCTSWGWVEVFLHSRSWKQRQEGRSLRVLSVSTGLLCINPAPPQSAGITVGKSSPGRCECAPEVSTTLSCHGKLLVKVATWK